MRLLCFDIEAADDRQMLELSIFDCETGVEVYHSYFKPFGKMIVDLTFAKHHISAEMVKTAPRIDDEKSKIESILNSADGFVGFGLNNDLSYLQDNGVLIRDEIVTVDAQDWFHYIERDSIEYKSGEKSDLENSARHCGLDFDECCAHSATYDTHATLELFNYLYKKHAGPEISIEKIEETNNEIDEYNYRRMAKGYITLRFKDGLYVVRNNSNAPMPNANDIVIKVNSRYIAEHEIRSRFEPKRVTPGYYKLNVSDIEWFKGYSNEYDGVYEIIYRNKYAISKGKQYGKSKKEKKLIKNNFKLK